MKQDGKKIHQILVLREFVNDCRMYGRRRKKPETRTEPNRKESVAESKPLKNLKPVPIPEPLFAKDEISYY